MSDITRKKNVHRGPSKTKCCQIQCNILVLAYFSEKSPSCQNITGCFSDYSWINDKTGVTSSIFFLLEQVKHGRNNTSVPFNNGQNPTSSSTKMIETVLQFSVRTNIQHINPIKLYHHLHNINIDHVCYDISWHQINNYQNTNTKALSNLKVIGTFRIAILDTSSLFLRYPVQY